MSDNGIYLIIVWEVCSGNGPAVVGDPGPRRSLTPRRSGAVRGGQRRSEAVRGGQKEEHGA